VAELDRHQTQGGTDCRRFRDGSILCDCPGASRVFDAHARLCLDGFCIGQSIKAPRFDAVTWITPQDFTKEVCRSVGCTPRVAFRGYPVSVQTALAEAVSWLYSASLWRYNILTKSYLGVLRHYQYECNMSARGWMGERRFFGAYRSVLSQYLTVIGLRLIDGELRVYRIGREYPYHNNAEILGLAANCATSTGNGSCHMTT
jgi:hypothetical protein